MPTITASHMIAAFILVTSDGALGAVDCSCFLFPFFKLVIFLALTAFTGGVRLHATWETDTCHAVVTNNIVLVFVRTFANVALTGRVGAPSQVWIQINHCISLEALVFRKKRLVSTIAYLFYLYNVGVLIKKKPAPWQPQIQFEMVSVKCCVN